MLLLLSQDVPALAYAQNPVDGDRKAKSPPPVGQARSTEHFIQAEELGKHRALFTGIKKDVSRSVLHEEH